jgi:hypothetical protein
MGKDRHIRVTGQRKRTPDYRKLSAALLAYVAAQAEADAEQQGRKTSENAKPPARSKNPRNRQSGPRTGQ